MVLPFHSIPIIFEGEILLVEVKLNTLIFNLIQNTFKLISFDKFNLSLFHSFLSDLSEAFEGSRVAEVYLIESSIMYRIKEFNFNAPTILLDIIKHNVTPDKASSFKKKNIPCSDFNGPILPEFTILAKILFGPLQVHVYCENKLWV